MGDAIVIKTREWWTMERALEYIKDRPQPSSFSLTWLIRQLPEGVGIAFPRITESFPDLNATDSTAPVKEK